MKIGEKLCNFVALYRSPSQSQDEFETFAKNLELNLNTISANNLFLTVVTGVFNAKSNFWYKNDKTTYEGSKIDGIASQFGLHQLINEPTHLTRSTSSCINSIFTSQPNLVMESGVYSSLHENYHHQISCAKFNLKIYYPPPYEQEVWHYQRANVENIRKAISEFPWERRFANSDETIICNDRNPPWINDNIKKLINDKNRACAPYRLNENNSSTCQHFQFLQSRLNSLIEKSKLKYYARLSKKLLDPATSPKSYWSILKIFLNNKEIPCIPPLLHENKFIIDFRRKAEIFNTFFAKQCSLINTCSDLPTTLTKKTHESLSTIRFRSDDTLKIIKNFDPNKAHGHDMISIRTVKLYDASLCKPLELIFK